MARINISKVLILVLACVLMLSAASLSGCINNTAPGTTTANFVTTAPITSTGDNPDGAISDQEKQDLIDRTIAYQTDGNIYHADHYSVVKLKRGDIIYGMLPGQSAFYTDQATLDIANGSYKSMYRLLQIRPHPVYGYRTKAGRYEVQADIYVTAGRCLANREISIDGKTENLGEGGGYQYVIFDFAQQLKLIEEITLHE